jgi:hypothetical protein
VRAIGSNVGNSAVLGGLCAMNLFAGLCAIYPQLPDSSLIRLVSGNDSAIHHEVHSSIP